MGFTSLVYEVYSAKILFLYFVESTHAVAVTLSAFLAGLGISALACTRYATEDQKRAHGAVAGLQIAAAAYAVFVLRRYEIIPDAVDWAHRVFGRGPASDVGRALFAWIYSFLPGLFIGGAFPILTGLYVNDIGARTRDVGVVYFWDTVGAIIGALIAGFVLLPWLGLRRAVFVPAALNLVVVTIVVERRAVRVGAALAATVCLALAFWSPGVLGAASNIDIPKDVAKSRLGAGFGRIVAQEPSPFGLVTVGDDAMGKPGSRALFVNWRDMCHTAGSASERALATNTVAELEPGARVLNIGLGCGITAGTLASSPKVTTLEIAEINPVVARMARDEFAEPNGRVLDLPKTRLFIEDGAELVRESTRTYDAVVIDVEEPTIVHSSLLYTREYFEIIRRKLSPRGLLALWMIGQDHPCGKVIFNTLRAVFADVEVSLLPAEPNFLFFASARALHLPRQTGEATRAVDDMEALPIDDVNTVDDRALERDFDIRKAFALPRDYDETGFSDLERARRKATPSASPGSQ